MPHVWGWTFSPTIRVVAIESPRRANRTGLLPKAPAAASCWCWEGVRPVTPDGTAWRGGGGGGEQQHAGGEAGGQGGEHPGPPRPDGAPADGELHQLGGEHGQHEGHRRAEQEERPAHHAHPGRGHHQDHRPVPQVEAVGDLPDVDQRGAAQHPGGEPGGRLHHPEDDQADHHVGQEEAAPVGEGGALVEPDPLDGEAGRRRHHQDRHPPPPRAGGGRGPVGQGDGHHRPDQQVLGAGVGAVVEAAGVGARVVEEPHLHRRGRRRHHGERQQGPERPAPLEHPHHHQRPDQVELLLDGQGPGVEQRGGHRGDGEVALPRLDLVPVPHVEEGGQGVDPEGRPGAAGATSQA